MKHELKLLKAFRVDENTVKVLFFHKQRKEEFVVEWNNIHPITGELTDYRLQIDCMSRSQNLNEIVEQAILEGGDYDAQYRYLYIQIRDKFDAQDCEELDKSINILIL